MYSCAYCGDQTSNNDHIKKHKDDKAVPMLESFQKVQFTRAMRRPLHVPTVVKEILEAHGHGGAPAAEKKLEEVLRLVGVGSSNNQRFCLPLYAPSKMF